MDCSGAGAALLAAGSAVVAVADAGVELAAAGVGVAVADALDEGALFVGAGDEPATTSLTGLLLPALSHGAALANSRAPNEKGPSQPRVQHT